jgi:hypothetical protein
VADYGGRVVDAAGEPVAGLRVRLAGTDLPLDAADPSAPELVLRTRTDGDGRFRLRGPDAPGVRVLSEDWRLPLDQGIRPGEPATFVVRPAFSLVVTAVDADQGRPVLSFEGRASHPGRFYQPFATAGGKAVVNGPRWWGEGTASLVLTVQAEGFAPVDVPVEIPAQGSKEVVLRLPPVRPGDEAHVTVEVLDASGSPLDGDWVVRIVDPEDDRRTVAEFGIERVGTGRYEATLPPGWWTVLVKSNDWLGFLRFTERANLVSGRNVVRARMAPRGTLVVRWPPGASDGHDVPLSVSPLAGGGGGSSVGRLGGKTEFRSAFVPEGEWGVRLGDETRRATVRAGEETVVDFGAPAGD